MDDAPECPSPREHDYIETLVLTDLRISSPKFFLFGFMSALYSGLWAQFHNGRQLQLNVIDFVLPPDPITGRQMLPGERVYREGQAAILSMLEGQRGSTSASNA